MNSPDPVHSRAALERRFGPSYRWRVLATVMIGTVASIMASTIVNVAVPDMAHVFALGQERAQWLSAGFMGALTLSMLTTPWLHERYGYRHTYIGAVVLLMIGGVVGGFGSRFEIILAMRVTEGLAAGVLQPIPAIIILHAFGEGERGKAMGIFGFGQAFRSKARDAAMLVLLKSDPHSPDEFRVNGAVRNHPAFYTTFGVRPGDRMYLAPERRVSIW